jgi:hypothetical protein
MGSLQGGLDEQIEQLMQCKPLAEPEVPLLSIYSPLSSFGCLIR